MKSEGILSSIQEEREPNIANKEPDRSRLVESKRIEQRRSSARKEENGLDGVEQAEDTRDVRGEPV